MKYTPIVGMEVHVELKTVSKMFCGCKNDPFHAPKPNIYTCPVCLGLPGGLPVPNRKAVEWTIRLGLALNCQIPELSKFDRKNYFYPDLPKGYQISQYDQPLAVGGWLEISPTASASFPRHRESSGDPRLRGDDNLMKRIGITRVHLEEDTGKLQHATVDGPTSPSGLRGASKKVSLIDFNRSGVPLVEIVTEPDIRSSEEARVFLKKLHQIIRYLGISDADMEKGSMRLEPNISVLKVQSSKFKVQSDIEKFKIDELPKYKVEVKNINSYRFATKAIEFEIKRQIELLEKGETPKQETRGWEEKKGVTLPQRSKEEAHDYQYFPEPDIPPMRWTEKQISGYRLQIPELPDVKLARFIEDFGLPAQDAERLVEDKELAEYFEKSLQFAVSSMQYKNLTAKTIANWLLNKNVDIIKTSPQALLNQIISSQQKVSVDEGKLEKVVEQVLSQNSQAAASFKAGKTGVIMFLVGQAMKSLSGKGDPQTIRNLLEKKLQ